MYVYIYMKTVHIRCGHCELAGYNSSLPKGTVMQIEKTLINDRLRVSRVS